MIWSVYTHLQQIDSNMAKELFKNANLSNIRNLLQTFTGTPLTKFDAFPKSYVLNTQPNNHWAELSLQYSDFKEAFCRFNLIARTCAQMNYYPELFNVYNRIVVRIYSPGEGSSGKVLTQKDLYVSHYLHELQTKTVDQSHKAAIQSVARALEE